MEAFKASEQLRLSEIVRKESNHPISLQNTEINGICPLVRSISDRIAKILVTQSTN